MAQLNTRIILRNDSLANWELHSDVVLLKGEIGVAFDDTGVAKVKIGDGIKTWSELDWFGETDLSGITEQVLTLQQIVGAPANTEDGTAATGMYAEIATKPTYTETQTMIAEAISGVDHLSYKKVGSYDEIDPAAENATKFIYLVPQDGDEGTDGDGFDEYMILDGKVELIGTLSADLSGYVQKQEGYRLMSEDEGDKLASMLAIKTHSTDFVITESGELQLNAEMGRLITKTESTVLERLIAGEGEQLNLINAIKMNGTALAIDETGAVNIPVATADALGVVKGSESVSIAEDGTMQVALVNVDNLTQDDGSTLVLNGGGAA